MGYVKDGQLFIMSNLNDKSQPMEDTILWRSSLKKSKTNVSNQQGLSPSLQNEFSFADKVNANNKNWALSLAPLPEN